MPKNRKKRRASRVVYSSPVLTLTELTVRSFTEQTQGPFAVVGVLLEQSYDGWGIQYPNYSVEQWKNLSFAVQRMFEIAAGYCAGSEPKDQLNNRSQLAWVKAHRGMDSSEFLSQIYAMNRSIFARHLVEQEWIQGWLIETVLAGDLLLTIDNLTKWRDINFGRRAYYPDSLRSTKMGASIQAFFNQENRCVLEIRAALEVFVPDTIAEMICGYVGSSMFVGFEEYNVGDFTKRSLKFYHMDSLAHFKTTLLGQFKYACTFYVRHLPDAEPADYYEYDEQLRRFANYDFGSLESKDLQEMLELIIDVQDHIRVDEALDSDIREALPNFTALVLIGHGDMLVKGSGMHESALNRWIEEEWVDTRDDDVE